MRCQQGLQHHRADKLVAAAVAQTHRGDLYVLYSIAFPKALSEEQKAAVRQQFPPETAFEGLGGQAHDEL